MKVELSRINIITGKRDAGKTTLCVALVEKFVKMGFSTAGIVSPGIYKGEKKIGINAVNIRNGEKIKLADYSPGWDLENPRRMWKMNPHAIPWGNRVLKDSVPCDVLIIDEIGFLEFDKKSGWKTAFDILEGNLFRIGFIVIRKGLVGSALAQFKEAKSIDLVKGTNLNLIIKNISLQTEISLLI